jgi:hypothetical protein
MMNRKHTLAFAAALALTAFATPPVTVAQSNYDDQAQLIAQIQADKRAVVLKAMQLSDAEVESFTPIYDKYQADRKKLMGRSADLLNKYASNYGSMTDDAAKDLLKDWMKLRNDDNALVEKYAKQVERALSPTHALRFVQVENKLNTLLQAETQSMIPLAK